MWSASLFRFDVQLCSCHRFNLCLGFFLSFLADYPHKLINNHFNQSFSRSTISSLQLRARKCSGWCPEQHNHHRDMGASPRGLWHNHQLVHSHLPETPGPRPKQTGVQDRRRPGRGMKDLLTSFHKNSTRMCIQPLNMCNFNKGFSPLSTVHPPLSTFTDK